MLRVLSPNSTFFTSGTKYMIFSLIRKAMETLKTMLGRISHPKHSTKLPGCVIFPLNHQQTPLSYPQPPPQKKKKYLSNPIQKRKSWTFTKKKSPPKKKRFTFSKTVQPTSTTDEEETETTFGRDFEHLGDALLAFLRFQFGWRRQTSGGFVPPTSFPRISG